jgi:hypothetical protein
VKASRVGLRDPNRPGGVMDDSHGVWKSKNACRRRMETVSDKSSGKAMAS